MIVPIPSQYLAQVTSSWNAYQYAIAFGSDSLQESALSVLMVWLNRCNTVLGHPKVLRPYPDPPSAPAVVVDEATGEMTGDLEYPTP